MKLIRLICAAVLVCASCLAATHKAVLPAFYNRWLKEDVVYIITEDERKEFLKLDSNEARDSFIETFWALRNPLRGSDKNPYKDEHYARIAYANQNFGRESNTPGWMTDMGRTWVLFGKPQTKASYKGYGQLYPVDLWFYSNETGGPSLPPFFYVMFYMDGDIGQYKFYRPNIDGPMKLVRGSQFNSNRDVYKFLLPISGDLAHAAFSLLPNDPIDKTSFQPDLSSDMLVTKIQNLANDSFNVRRIRELRSLRSDVKSYLLIADDRPLDLSAIALSDPIGQAWLDYSVLIDRQILGEVKADQMAVSTSYRLLNDAGELIAEDSEAREYPAFTGHGEDRKFVPFQIANRIPLVPGAFRLEVEIRNRQAGKSFHGERKIQVPKAGQAAVLGPLLVSSVEQVREPGAMVPFQYFGVQFHPAIGRKFDRRTPIRALLELRAALPNATAYSLDYLLANTNNREMRREQRESIPAASFQEGRLLKSITVPFGELEAGEYRLIVNLRAAESPAVLASSTTPLVLGADSENTQIYFSSNAKKLSSPGLAAYIRGLEAASQKDEAASAVYFSKALDQNPGNAFASRYLIQLYFNAHRFGPVTDLYKKVGDAAFQASPESLAQISLSFWESGERDQARKLLMGARASFPKDPMLATAAKTIR